MRIFMLFFSLWLLLDVYSVTIVVVFIVKRLSAQLLALLRDGFYSLFGVIH